MANQIAVQTRAKRRNFLVEHEFESTGLSAMQPAGFEMEVL